MRTSLTATRIFTSVSRSEQTLLRSSFPFHAPAARDAFRFWASLKASPPRRAYFLSMSFGSRVASARSTTRASLARYSSIFFCSESVAPDNTLSALTEGEPSAMPLSVSSATVELAMAVSCATVDMVRSPLHGDCHPGRGVFAHVPAHLLSQDTRPGESSWQMDVGEFASPFDHDRCLR